MEIIQPDDVMATTIPEQLDYSDNETRTLTKEMSDKIYNDSYSTTEEELKTDTNWIEATKDVYKELEGLEWSGADEDAAKTGLDMMSRFNYNLTLGTINYTAKLQDADPKTKLAFYYMMDMYDKKDISGNGVMRAFKEMGLDPASYIGIGTLGMGFAGKQAAGTAAKTGLKAMLKEGAMKFLQNTTAVAATESAIYTGADDFARQDAAVGAGVQDEYSPGQTAVATTLGGAIGAGFVKGGQGISRKVSGWAKEGEEEMAKAAGGGTPPTQSEGVRITTSQNTDNPIVKITPETNEFSGEITLLKNKEKAPNMGAKFGQDVEPSGFYAIQKESSHLDDNPNYETVKANVSNPLIVDVSDDLVQWKRDLSTEYKAKGKSLTNKLLKKGYDSIITTDKNGELGEIIILDTSKIQGDSK